MKAVVSLVWTYFSATPLARWLTGVTLAFTALVTIAMLNVPDSAVGRTRNTDFGWYYAKRLLRGAPDSIVWAAQALTPVAYGFVVVGLFFAAALLPRVVGNYGGSRQLHMLPHGRSKVLASALATLLVVGIPGALLISSGWTAVMTRVYGVTAVQVFSQSLMVMWLMFTVMYMILWLIGRAQNAVTFLIGTVMLVGACLTVPSSFVLTTTPSASGNPIDWRALYACIVVWSGFAAVYCWLPKRGRTLGRFDTRLIAALRPRFLQTRYTPGQEIEWIVGTARPGLLAISLVVAAAVMYPLIGNLPPIIWLGAFQIMGMIAGAATNAAAVRTRALWLRRHWLRSDIFARTEAAFLRFNAYMLSTLIALWMVIGTLQGFPPLLMALGLPLILLTVVVSTYLGLIITRGLGWLEFVLAVTTVVMLIWTTYYTGRMRPSPIDLAYAPDVPTAVTLDAALLLLAVMLRFLARHRWQQIDWMLCRPERTARGVR